MYISPTYSECYGDCVYIIVRLFIHTVRNSVNRDMRGNTKFSCAGSPHYAFCISLKSICAHLSPRTEVAYPQLGNIPTLNNEGLQVYGVVRE